MWRTTDNPEPRTLQAVLDALVKLPVCTDMQALGEATGIPYAPLAVLVNTLISRGLVEFHTLNNGQEVVVLSTLGAERLGVELSEYSEAWEPIKPRRKKGNRWEWTKPSGVKQPEGSNPGFRIYSRKDPDVRRYLRETEEDAWLNAHEQNGFGPRGGLSLSEDWGRVDFVDDTIAPPWAIAEAEEAIERAFAQFKEGQNSVVPPRVPRARVLIEGGIWWEAPQTLPIKATCPKHTEKDMECLVAYCLYCDASGADHLIPRPGRGESPKKGSYSYAPGDLQGGTGRRLA